MFFIPISNTKLNLSDGRPLFQSQVAILLRFMAEKTSIACMVTLLSPRKVVHRIPCFSFKSAKTRSMVSFRSA